MEKNKKILKIGLVVISISLIFSISFAMITKLKNPVFLKSYMDHAFNINEDENYSDVELILPYFTDVNDDRYIMDITFEEAPELDILTSNHSFGLAFPNYYTGRLENVYGRYKVKTLYVKLDLNSMDSNIEELELKNAIIVFEDGQRQKVDIGKMKFYRYNYEEEYKYLESLGSGSSSDGTGNIDYRVLEDITLLKLDSPLLEELNNSIELNIGKLNYLDIEGVEYKKRNSFSIHYRRNFNKDIMGKFIPYKISPNLYFKDDSGNIHTKRIREIMNNHHYFNYIDILKYLRARGEI